MLFGVVFNAHARTHTKTMHKALAGKFFQKKIPYLLLLLNFVEICKVLKMIKSQIKFIENHTCVALRSVCLIGLGCACMEGGFDFLPEHLFNCS